MCRLYGIVCLLFTTLLVWDECYFSSFSINGPKKSPFIRVPMQSWHRKNINRNALGPYIGRKQHGFERSSLRSRRLEVVGTRKNGRARRRHARGEGYQLISWGRKRFSWAFRAGAPSPLACLPCARPFSLSPITSKRSDKWQKECWG